MINGGMYHTELVHKGQQIIIDICYIYGRYETMVMSPDCTAIEETSHISLDDAVSDYNNFLLRYPADTAKEKFISVPSLSGKYKKLCDDLRNALEAGRNAELANPEDGGACNFDSAAIRLPRWQSEKVRAAAKSAGCTCSEWQHAGKCFIFSPDTRGQANARSRNAEAMTAALRSCGYNAFDYCALD